MPSNYRNEQINAIFGGTFDPPHIGHLMPLQETADILQLPSVSLMPANIPALKQGMSEGHHRIEMTRLLCDLDPRFTVDLSEFERNSVSYTVNTLKQMKENRPKQTIIFIIGLDSLLSLHKWHNWEQLFNYCHLVVMLRPPLNSSAKDSKLLKHKSEEVALNLYDFYTSENEFNRIVGKEMDNNTRHLLISKLAHAVNDIQSINHSAFRDIIEKSAMGNLWFINNRVLSVSSSEIRQQIKTGVTPNNLVPQSILDYIQQHQLYKF